MRLGLAVGATLAVAALAVVYPLVERGSRVWLDADWRYAWVFAFLALVPLLWWFGTLGQDSRRPRLRIGTVAAIRRGPRGVRTYLRDLPGVLRTVAVALGVLALARPVSTLSDQTSDEQGIDIMVVLDLSGSMRAVLDADPKDLPNTSDLPRNARITRVDAAKIVVEDFITRRRTDRMGVIVFGKDAYVLSPPTLDYQLLGSLVSKLSLDVIDGSATAIGDALGAAVARMRRSDAASKVVILLTDGDSNAGMVSPEFAIEAAVEKGCKVYTVQIGNGDEVQVQDSVDVFGQPHYVKTRFPVNPELLNRIAAQTGGQHFVATDAKGLAQSFHAVLDQLEKTRFEAQIASYEDLFPFLVLPAVLLVALDALLRAWLLRRFP
ncbi:MAG: VWA domain-containing protein [Polyangiaceae bacterium]|nr:VWA domain-containing protein [Polyangiaceae bacterium]